MEKQTSPIGKTAAAGAARRAARSAAYRAARAETARTAAIAKLLIQRRTELGLTQEAVANRAGTSYSQISRIESGRHDVNTKTLDKVFRALGVRPLFGYEVPSARGRPARRELIAV